MSTGNPDRKIPATLPSFIGCEFSAADLFLHFFKKIKIRWKLSGTMYQKGKTYTHKAKAPTCAERMKSNEKENADDPLVYNDRNQSVRLQPVEKHGKVHFRLWFRIRQTARNDRERCEYRRKSERRR
ncbi:MAG: hypothetical protein LUE31_10960 [Lachnospiraceae bacterium]|nr:hypothetical protein [Lachnospiraceae bacterium]